MMNLVIQKTEVSNDNGVNFVVSSDVPLFHLSMDVSLEARVPAGDNAVTDDVVRHNNVVCRGGLDRRALGHGERVVGELLVFIALLTI